MTFETLRVEQHGTVLTVTLNRPQALNALTGQLIGELSAVVAGVAADAGVRALVLTGAGDRAFVAGADINELAVACTLRLASNTAQFGQPEVDLGIIPGFGGSQRLARLIGRGRALALLL